MIFVGKILFCNNNINLFITHTVAPRITLVVLKRLLSFLGLPPLFLPRTFSLPSSMELLFPEVQWFYKTMDKTMYKTMYKTVYKTMFKTMYKYSNTGYSFTLFGINISVTLKNSSVGLD